MNNTIKELMQRQSIRAYLDKEISKEDKKMIIDAAVNAPSAGNMQMYSIIDVTDQSLKDKLQKFSQEKNNTNNQNNHNNQNNLQNQLVLGFCLFFFKFYIFSIEPS